MRVLMACKENEHAYITSLSEGLRNIGLSVDVGLAPFWGEERDYDVIHIHWPESLFGWKNPTWPEVRVLLNDALPSWRRSAKVVITRHNSVPHDIEKPRSTVEYVYKNIYKQVDGVIHLGKNEKKIDLVAKNAIHAIIPHHIYSTYGSAIDTIEARNQLKIPKNKKVILVFGSIRNEREKAFVQEAFFGLDIKSKLFLAPTFGTPVRPARKSLLCWLLWELRHREIFWPRYIHSSRARVPDSNVHLYFSAADIVLLPRLDTLNSGILPLAFQYGKVVAGADIGNIGPILKDTNNPTFNPKLPASCKSALKDGLQLALKKHGEKNRIYAKKHWCVYKIAQMHKNYYKKLASYLV